MTLVMSGSHPVTPVSRPLRSAWRATETIWKSPKVKFLKPPEYGPSGEQFNIDFMQLLSDKFIDPPPSNHGHKDKMHKYIDENVEDEADRTCLHWYVAHW